MVTASGWKRIRNWLVPWGDPVIRNYLANGPGAQCADKQPPPLACPLPITVMADAFEQPAALTQAPLTRIDPLGRFGLKEYEVAWFVEDLGSLDRVFDVLEWVVRAHRWQEMAELPLDKRDLGIASLRDAHPKAVRTVARLLEQVMRLENASVPEIRAIFHRRTPGFPFPLARSVNDMQQVIAVAWNMNEWFALNGTHLCGSPALPLKGSGC